MPSSSLIIPTRNRPRLVVETVRSVVAGSAVPSEIVVVDQGATAGELLAGVPAGGRTVIRHVPTTSIGLSRARNEGVQAARHEWLAFVDDDMFVAPGWYDLLVGTLVAAGPKAVVTGSVHAAPAERGGGFISATITRPERQVYEGRLSTDVLSGGNMAMSRSALVEVGPFDERLGAGSRWASAEDNDMGFRLLAAGYRIHYVPEAIVYHRAWRPSRDYFGVRWAYGVGKGGFYTKHASPRDLHTIGRASRDVGSRLLGLPAQVIRSRRKAVGDVIYSVGVLWGAARWLATQHSARNER